MANMMQCHLRQSLHLRTRDHDDLVYAYSRRLVLDMGTSVPMAAASRALFFDSRPYTLPNLFLAIQMTCICFSHIPKISTHRAIKAVGNILGMGQSMQNHRVTLFSRQTLFLNNYPTTHWNKLVIFNVSTLLTITLVMLRLELEDAIGINSHR